MKLSDIKDKAKEYKNEAIATTSGLAIGASMTPAYLTGIENPKTLIPGALAIQFGLVASAVHSAKTLKSASHMTKGIVTGLALSTAICYQSGMVSETIENIKNAQNSEQEVIQTLENN